MVPSGGKSPDFILLCPAFDAASGCLTTSLESVCPTRELHVLASSFVVSSSVLTLLQEVTRLQQTLEQWCIWNCTFISLSLPGLPSLFVPFVQLEVFRCQNEVTPINPLYGKHLDIIVNSVIQYAII